MKKLKIWALSIMSVAALGLTSCETETPDAPTVNVISPNGNVTVFIGDSVDVEVTASTNEELVSFQVVKTFGGNDVVMVDSTLANNTRSFTFSEKLFTATVEGTASFMFTVTDNNGLSNSAGFNANVVESLSDTIGGIVYNIAGPNKGAWDFVADMALASADDTTGKDIVDNSGNNDPIYLAQWTSLNGTMYVLTDTVDIYTTDLNEITEVYNASTPVATTPSLTVGDVVIAYNTRFPSDYVVVEVTEVVDTQAPPIGDNLDYVSFIYRK